MLNFKHKRNLALLVCFIFIAAWNVKIGFDLLNTIFKSFVILNFLAILFSSLALGTSIRSRKIVMEAYQGLKRDHKGI